MPTIKDVARLAGVSTATVSRVLNKADNVSPKTIEKVETAIAKIQYHPNLVSTVFRTQQTNMIHALFPRLMPPFSADLIQSTEKAAADYNYNIILSSLDYERCETDDLSTLLRGRQTDGLIVFSPTLINSEIIQLSKDYPIVQTCIPSLENNLTSVHIDDFAATYQASKHLIQAGCRCFAIISFILQSSASIRREEGIIKALKDAGLSLNPKLLVRGDYTFNDGYSLALHLLIQAERPDAIMCGSDLMAAGAIKAIHEFGLKVPSDISVFGFDNIPLCTMVSPTISTISQPIKQIGQLSVSTLMQKINNMTIHSNIVVPHEIIIRESSK